MGLIYYLEDLGYLDILRKYFNVSGSIDNDELELEVHEKYEGFGDIHIYDSAETGRILIMRKTNNGSDELLLFSPLGSLEEDSVGSIFESKEVEMIIEKILKKNRDFRNRLIKDFCRSRERFNINFKESLNVKFDFFLQCEAIAEINPFCSNRNSFKNCIDIISLAVTPCNQKVKGLVKPKKNEIKSIDALEGIFERINKKDDIADDLECLRTILRLRNAAPTHNINHPFVQVLKRFNKKYPDPNKPEEWCDLLIFLLQKTSRIVDKFSNVLIN